MILKIKSLIFMLVNRILRLIYPIRIMDTESSIKFINETGNSLCRFGEGEMNLLARRKDLKFQKYDENLAKRMQEILVTNSKNISIAIPLAIKNCHNLNNRAKEFWDFDTSYSMVDWVKYTSVKKNYLDSLMTRNYIDLKDRSRTQKIYEMWKKIWDNKKVLIIEGNESRLGVGNDLFLGVKEIKRILCPSINAFEAYDKILMAAKRQSKDYLVLLALGPTASVLAFDLANCGYQALDVGHIDIEYEWYKMGVDTPVKVPGKFTNEVKNGNVVENNASQNYLEQIIEVIL